MNDSEVPNRSEHESLGTEVKLEDKKQNIELRKRIYKYVRMHDSSVKKTDFEMHIIGFQMYRGGKSDITMKMAQREKEFQDLK